MHNIKLFNNFKDNFRGVTAPCTKVGKFEKLFCDVLIQRFFTLFSTKEPHEEMVAWPEPAEMHVWERTTSEIY